MQLRLEPQSAFVRLSNLVSSSVVDLFWKDSLPSSGSFQNYLGTKTLSAEPIFEVTVRLASWPKSHYLSGSVSKQLAGHFSEDSSIAYTSLRGRLVLKLSIFSAVCCALSFREFRGILFCEEYAVIGSS